MGPLLFQFSDTKSAIDMLTMDFNIVSGGIVPTRLYSITAALVFLCAQVQGCIVIAMVRS